MKTIELGRPIEIDQETDDLLQNILEAESESLDLKVLQAAIPDTRRFVEFLKRRDLMGTAAAKSILNQLGAAGSGRAVPAMAAKVLAREKGPRTATRALAKRRAGKRAKVAARKKTRKAKRRKYAKRKAK